MTTHPRWDPQQAYLVEVPRFDPPDMTRIAWVSLLRTPAGRPCDVIAYNRLTAGLGWLRHSEYDQSDPDCVTTEGVLVATLAKMAAAAMPPDDAWNTLTQGLDTWTAVPQEVAGT